MMRAWWSHRCGVVAALCGSLCLGGATACGGSSATDLTSSDAGDDGATAARGPAGTVVEDGGTLGVDASTGPGGSAKTLPCGTANCRVPAESCCLTDNANGTFTFFCAAGPTCPLAAAGSNAPVALGCSSAVNCSAPSVCCITQQSENTGASGQDHATSACKAACDSQEAQLCDPKATNTGCPQTAACSASAVQAWELPPSFGTCGGKAP